MVQCTVYSVQCTLYDAQCTLLNTVQCTLYNTRNIKWKSNRPAHRDSIKHVARKIPINCCEYYRGIMFQLPQNDICIYR